MAPIPTGPAAGWGGPEPPARGGGWWAPRESPSRPGFAHDPGERGSGSRTHPTRQHGLASPTQNFLPAPPTPPPLLRRLLESARHGSSSHASPAPAAPPVSFSPRRLLAIICGGIGGGVLTLGSLEIRILQHYYADELMKAPKCFLPAQGGGLKQSGVYSSDAGRMLSGSAGPSIVCPRPEPGAAPRHPQPRRARRLLDGAQSAFSLAPGKRPPSVPCWGGGGATANAAPRCAPTQGACRQGGGRQNEFTAWRGLGGGHGGGGRWMGHEMNTTASSVPVPPCLCIFMEPLKC